MKAKVWVEQQVEVEITAQDAIEALADLDHADRLHWAINGINSCYGFIRRIPVEVIQQMNEKQRGLIANALKQEALRFEIRDAAPEREGNK